MSLIHLSSIGQRPYDFTNTFPQGITLGKHAEVCLVGYSGVLKGNEATDLREDDILFVVQQGVNDGLALQHADLSRPLNQQQWAACSISVVEEMGINGLEVDADEMAIELAAALNNQDPKTDMIWSCAFAPAPNLLYTIECEKKRFPVGDNEGTGAWVEYGVGAAGTQGVVNVNVITPAIGGGAFLNTQPGFMGDCGAAIGAVTGQGWTCSFDIAVANRLTDIQFTYGITSPPFVTMFDRTGKESDMSRGSSPPIGSMDFAYPRNNSAWVLYGFDVDVNTGEVFTIEGADRMPVDAEGVPLIGSMKTGEGQQTRRGTGILLTPGVLATCRFNLSPRYDGATRRYKMEYSVDNGGGVYVVVNSVFVGSAVVENPTMLTCPYARQNAALHDVICYNQEYITAATVVTALSNLPASGGTAGGGDSNTPICIAFRPLTDLEVFATIPAAAENCANLIAESMNANMLGMEMGYISPMVMSAVTSTTGWVGDQKPTEVVTDLNPPFLITCPDIPIRGYVGAGTGGGAESQLLGVGRIRGMQDGNAFSNEPTAAWLKLNNEYNIRLDRLNIVLRDEENKIYKRLLPNFSCWLQFRCPKKQKYLGKERDLSVGATYTDWGDTMGGQNDNYMLEHANIAENPMSNRPN